MAHIDDPQTQRANLSFIKASMQEPLLSRELEQDLARRWRYKQDEKALHQLVRAYTRLVVSTATKFRNYGLPMDRIDQREVVELFSLYVPILPLGAGAKSHNFWINLKENQKRWNSMIGTPDLFSTDDKTRDKLSGFKVEAACLCQSYRRTL